MKKVALVFLLAVFVPSVVLAWLAVHSLRDQQFVLERQQSLLYQGVTDSFAKEINDYLSEQQREFATQVENLLNGKNPALAAVGFDDQLRKNWPLAEVGFCVSLSGNILCPTCASPTNRLEARIFCQDNGSFLGNRESAEVYWNNTINSGNFDNSGTTLNSSQTGSQKSSAPATSLSGQPAQEKNLYGGKVQNRKVNPGQQQMAQPAQFDAADGQNLSKVVPAEAEFRQLIGDGTDGMMARILQNKLRLMFWHRPERYPQLIFGAQLDLGRISEVVRELILDSPEYGRLHPLLGSRNTVFTLPERGRKESPERKEICLVVVDDNAKPVAVSDHSLYYDFLNPKTRGSIIGSFEESFRQNFKTDLKHPFVATEIGEALPHWEVAAYLKNPDKFKQSARTIQLTLGLLILVLVFVIGVGSWLIVGDLNRHLKLARQKTDFVSNVSHELKTPLTSIRMFSELLAEGRVSEPAKQRSYLNIITAETARLTRLINNVLDFSRMERGEKKYDFQDCDLAGIVRDTAESYRPHLENNGFKLQFELPASPIPVRGDADALAQVIVNLLSNAEKYSNGGKEIEIRVERREIPLPHAEVKVMDRGAGVPRGCEGKIFEQFYRAHDSLSSGVQGSGLGLTLARQIARAHGGDVVYEAREAGGSCFVLRLPLNQIETPGGRA